MNRKFTNESRVFCYSGTNRKLGDEEDEQEIKSTRVWSKERIANQLALN